MSDTPMTNADWWAAREQKTQANGRPYASLPRDKCVALECENASLSTALSLWEHTISEVMPKDFKDWWENDKQEWPEVTKQVILNLNLHVDYLQKQIELVAEKAAMMREALSKIRDIAAEACNDPKCKCTAARILAAAEGGTE
jgi:hypothetical protein